MGTQQDKEGRGVEGGEEMPQFGIDENELACFLVLDEILNAQQVDSVGCKILPIDLEVIYGLGLSLSAEPNNNGSVQVSKAVLLALAKNLNKQQGAAFDLERLGNYPNLEKAAALVKKLLCDLQTNSSPKDESLEALKEQNANLQYELEDAFEKIEELEHALEDAYALPSCRSRHRLQPLQHQVRPLVRARVRSDLITEPISPSFASLDEHISSIVKKNYTFLRLLSDNSGDIYTFGHCSVCTVILQAIASASDLTRLEKLMQQYAIIWDTNMTVTHQAKKSIACIDMKSPLSLALKALHKTEAQHTSEEYMQQLDAAVAAYNKYNGTDKTVLPATAFKTTGKMNNNIMMTMLILIGIRVSKKISLGRMREVKLSDPLKDAMRKEGIASLINLVVEITGVHPEEKTTIAWMYENVFIPACENPSHEVRLRLISCINFLIEEMQHCRYIEDYCNAEVISMTRLADNVDGYEVITLRETYKASLYVCERNNGGKGDFVAYWRRLVVAKVFFLSICSRLFAERAVETGLLPAVDEDLFHFGVLNTPSSNYRNDGLKFLFKEKNYEASSIISSSEGEDIKKILTAATTAIKQYESETHFAETKFKQYYKDFFASMR